MFILNLTVKQSVHGNVNIEGDIMRYVIGVDLGTSGIKILLVDQNGSVEQTITKEYPLYQDKSGYSEQNPEDWVNQTISGLSDLIDSFDGNVENIEGISFSGQMHSLVLLDDNKEVLRNAILWNDTRTTEECKEIYETVGEELLLDITKNIALEGFTLPKILWVKNHEPDTYSKASTFVLPKDYLRYRLTGKLNMEYSDAAGTLLLDVKNKKWSKKMCDLFDINTTFCPPLVSSEDEVGNIKPEIANKTGLSSEIRVFAGTADNAAGAIGSGILEDGRTMVSTGTSGVVLSYESSNEKDFQGKVHYFNHGAPDAFYSMGVTLAAGYSLSWFKDTFAKDKSFDELVNEIDSIPAGANGLLFAPYIVGERTPHNDSSTRGSFIGIDSSHEIKHFTRAVIEGITFSLNESLEIFRENGKKIDTVVSTGGGSKNENWLQIQADIFNTRVIKLSNEQGPGLGAAMLAAYGCNWFETLNESANEFLNIDKEFYPNKNNVETYKNLFEIYKEIYGTTKNINEEIEKYRK